jgi:hypothetical protein
MTRRRAAAKAAPAATPAEAGQPPQLRASFDPAILPPPPPGAQWPDELTAWLKEIAGIGGTAGLRHVWANWPANPAFKRRLRGLQQDLIGEAERREKGWAACRP